ELGLAVDGRARAVGDAAQPDERRPADGVEDRLVRLAVARRGGGRRGLRPRCGGVTHCTVSIAPAAAPPSLVKRTGSRAQVRTRLSPRRPGVKRNWYAPATATESNWRYPLDWYTVALSTTPIAVMWMRRMVSPSMPRSHSSTGYWNGVPVKSGDGRWSGSSPAQPAPSSSNTRESRETCRILVLPFRSARAGGRPHPAAPPDATPRVHPGPCSGSQRAGSWPGAA